MSIEQHIPQREQVKSGPESEWYNEVVRICQGRCYAPWFYADGPAWVELMSEGYTPLQAVDYQVSCL